MLFRLSSLPLKSIESEESYERTFNLNFGFSVVFSLLQHLFKLTKNMRANADECEFANFLLKVGNGELNTLLLMMVWWNYLLR